MIYGHAGNGHPHQNFIARGAGELTTIEGVVEQTLKHVLSLGGTVAAEHGIGKIKRQVAATPDESDSDIDDDGGEARA